MHPRDSTPSGRFAPPTKAGGIERGTPAVRDFETLLKRAQPLMAAAISHDFAALFASRKDRESLRKFAKTWAAFTIYHDAPADIAAEVCDEAITLTAVLDKWCARGVPTTTDPLVTEACPGRNDAAPDTRESSELLAAAVRHLTHAPHAPACRQLGLDVGGGASDEERLFYEACRRLLPACAFARLVPQASMESLGVGLAKAHDLRVDFALLLKSNWKWVVEIDGAQHADPVHAANDRVRDTALEKAEWCIHRIAAGAVREDADAAVRSWLEAMGAKGRSVLESLRTQPLREQRWADAAYTEIAFPCAVQRALRAWIQALRLGLLAYDGPWELHLPGPEWEAPYVALGVLRRWWRIAYDLGVVDNPPPEVRRVCCDSPQDGPLPLVEGLPAPTTDAAAPASLCMDFSAALPPGMHAAAGSKVAKYTLHVRCAYSAKRSTYPLTARRKFHPEIESLVERRGADAEQAHRAAAEDALRLFFGYPGFREGQYASVSRLISGRSTITLLPTGGGKSAIIHLAALLLPGAALVIEPLVALLTDQIENLREVFCDANAYVDGSLDGKAREEVMDDFRSGAIQTLFISPERLQINKFREAIRHCARDFPIALAAIDEAHCISEWGHDFRPSYLHLIHNLRNYASSMGSAPVVSALTGTASYAVLSDIQAELDENDEKSLVTPSTFGRKEIRYEVRDTKGNWAGELKALKRGLPAVFGLKSEAHLHDPVNKVGGIVFCATVASPYGQRTPSVNAVSAVLGHTHIYCGGRPKALAHLKKDWDAYKKQVLLDFKADALTEVIASKSIGMGFDKPNVRYCIHTSLPESIESFYQESGRAGRDGRPGARAYILANLKSLSDASVWDAETPEGKIAAIAAAEGEWSTRAYFLQQGFPGKDAEIARLAKFLTPCLNTRDTRKIAGDEGTEKLLFRGIMLGVIEDYTKEYMPGDNGESQEVFTVTFPLAVDSAHIIESLQQYLRRCKFDDYVNERFAGVTADLPTAQALRECIRIYVTYIYEEVLSRRLQSLRTMSELCLHFRDHETFNADMLAYLSESKYSESLRGWVGKSLREITSAEVMSAFLGADTMQNRNLLLGAARRTLDNDPGNAAVLWIIIITTLSLYPDRSQHAEVKRLLQLTRGALGEQGLPYELAVELWELVGTVPGGMSIQDEMHRTWLAHPQADEFARALLKHHPKSALSHGAALNHLLNRALLHTQTILSKL